MMKFSTSFFTLRQEAAERFWDLAAVPYLKFLMGAALAVFLLNLFFAVKIMQWSSQDLIILHYNVASGVDLIGGKYNLLAFPVLGIMVFLLNIGAAMSVKKAMKYSGWLLLASALAVNFILLISLGMIYVVNFR
jgi:hypothetical protein